MVVHLVKTSSGHERRKLGTLGTDICFHVVPLFLFIPRVSSYIIYWAIVYRLHMCNFYYGPILVQAGRGVGRSGGRRYSYVRVHCLTGQTAAAASKVSETPNIIGITARGHPDHPTNQPTDPSIAAYHVAHGLPREVHNSTEGKMAFPAWNGRCRRRGRQLSRRRRRRRCSRSFSHRRRGRDFEGNSYPL